MSKIRRGMPCPKPQTPEPRHSPAPSLFSRVGLPAVAGTPACALASGPPRLRFRRRSAGLQTGILSCPSVRAGHVEDPPWRAPLAWLPLDSPSVGARHAVPEAATS